MDDEIRWEDGQTWIRKRALDGHWTDRKDPGKAIFSIADDVLRAVVDPDSQVQAEGEKLYLAWLSNATFATDISGKPRQGQLRCRACEGNGKGEPGVIRWESGPSKGQLSIRAYEADEIQWRSGPTWARTKLPDFDGQWTPRSKPGERTYAIDGDCITADDAAKTTLHPISRDGFSAVLGGSERRGKLSASGDQITFKDGDIWIRCPDNPDLDGYWTEKGEPTSTKYLIDGKTTAKCAEVVKLKLETKGVGKYVGSKGEIQWASGQTWVRMKTQPGATVTAASEQKFRRGSPRDGWLEWTRPREAAPAVLAALVPVAVGLLALKSAAACRRLSRRAAGQPGRLVQAEAAGRRGTLGQALGGRLFHRWTRVLDEATGDPQHSDDEAFFG